MPSRCYQVSRLFFDYITFHHTLSAYYHQYSLRHHCCDLRQQQQQRRKKQLYGNTKLFQIFYSMGKTITTFLVSPELRRRSHKFGTTENYYKKTVFPKVLLCSQKCSNLGRERVSLENESTRANIVFRGCYASQLFPFNLKD